MLRSAGPGRAAAARVAPGLSRSPSRYSWASTGGSGEERSRRSGPSRAPRPTRPEAHHRHGPGCNHADGDTPPGAPPTALATVPQEPSLESLVDLNLQALCSVVDEVAENLLELSASADLERIRAEAEARGDAGRAAGAGGGEGAARGAPRAPAARPAAEALGGASAASTLGGAREAGHAGDLDPDPDADPTTSHAARLRVAATRAIEARFEQLDRGFVAVVGEALAAAERAGERGAAELLAAVRAAVLARASREVPSELVEISELAEEADGGRRMDRLRRRGAGPRGAEALAALAEAALGLAEEMEGGPALLDPVLASRVAAVALEIEAAILEGGEGSGGGAGGAGRAQAARTGAQARLAARRDAATASGEAFHPVLEAFSLPRMAREVPRRPAAFLAALLPVGDRNVRRARIYAGLLTGWDGALGGRRAGTGGEASLRPLRLLQALDFLRTSSEEWTTTAGEGPRGAGPPTGEAASARSGASPPHPPPPHDSSLAGDPRASSAEAARARTGGGAPVAEALARRARGEAEAVAALFAGDRLGEQLAGIDPDLTGRSPGGIQPLTRVPGRMDPSAEAGGAAGNPRGSGWGREPPGGPTPPAVAPSTSPPPGSPLVKRLRELDLDVRRVIYRIAWDERRAD